MSSRNYNGSAARKVELRNAAPTSVRGVLENALKRFGIDQEIARYQFVLHWAEIVGPDIARRTRPESLHKGLLRVRVADSTWAQELSFHKPMIIKRLQRFIDNGESIRDIMFYVGELKR